jgi:hypothetical protein
MDVTNSEIDALQIGTAFNGLWNLVLLLFIFL